MHLVGRLLWSCAALVGASSAGAQAPLPPSASPGTFDGTYVGVAAQFLDTMGTGPGRMCPKFAAPAPVTIANGRAQGRWGDYTLQGNVAPQGALTMSTGSGPTFQGQIDGQFVLRGRLSSACSYDLTWQRRR